jgi:urease accessory protein
MKPTATKSLFFLTALFLIPTFAQAHPGHGADGGLAHGFTHPFGGLDHILAMIAVGLWAAQLGKRALWSVPATFVGVMLLGGALGMGGFTLPFVEQGILASVFILGLLIAFTSRLPLAASAAVVGVFALFHGCAHGAEMPADSSSFAYMAGFAIATALLHAAGLGLGAAAQHKLPAPAIRFAGAAVVLAGLYLALS